MKRSIENIISFLYAPFHQNCNNYKHDKKQYTPPLSFGKVEKVLHVIFL